MRADLQGALDQINRSYRAFEHRGQKMSKYQVRKILEYGIKKGYKTTEQLSDEEVDKILEIKDYDEDISKNNTGHPEGVK